MTNNKTTTQERDKGKALPILVLIQLLIAAVTVAAAVTVGLKIKPLIEKKFQLEKDITEKEATIARIENELSQVETQLRASREAIAFVTDGINLYHQGQYERAVAAYNQALSLDPQNAYILNLKGYSLFNAKRLNEAVEVLRSAVEVQPDYAWGYFDLARASCANGNFDEASNAIRKALELRPSLVGIMKGDGEFTRLCKPLLNLLK